MRRRRPPADGLARGGRLTPTRTGRTADRVNDEKANGAFEDVIRCAGGAEVLPGCHTPCRENDDAIYHINAAIDVLTKRRDDRQERGVQGTDKP